MAEQPAEYPAPTPQLLDGSLWSGFRFFGPGAIIACVTIGSGETVFASRGGAIYGYTMLWCFTAGALCKAMQVYSASRFITLTGRSPLQSWMEIPGPRGWFVGFVAVMTVVWMPFWLSGLPKMLGEFSNWVVGYPHPNDAARYAAYGRAWGTFYIAVAILFTWVQTYGFLEKAQTAIVGLLLVCMVIAAVVSHPDWSAMLLGMVVPQHPRYAPWVLTKYPALLNRSPWVETMVYLGVIGGGAQDYLGYIGMLREKAWGLMGRTRLPEVGPPPPIGTGSQNVARGRLWTRAPRIDVSISFLSMLLFTAGFVVLGATVLNAQQTIPDGFHLLTEQARFLVLLTGDSAVLRFLVGWLYKTGIFFALFGTILGAYEIYTRTVHECLIALWPRLHTVPLKTIRLGTLIYCGGGGLALLWFLPADPVLIVTPASLVGSGLICGLWCFAMLWSDHVHLPKPLRMRWPLRLGVVASGCVLTVAPLIGLVEFIRDLAGP